MYRTCLWRTFFLRRARRPWWLAVALACAGAAQAETQLRDVVVTATRVETEADNVAASITSVTRQALDRRLPADAADLFRDEPDVAFARDVRRFGATSPNIRGLEDKRVLQLVDGVRLPDFYRGGGPTNFTTSAPLTTPPDFLKRAEVLRGPVSSLYGSDALGGVVGYLTLDPSDLLPPGETLALRPKLTHTGANDGWTGTLLAAGGEQEGMQWLLGYTRTEANEFDNQGSLDVTAPNRERPNPQDVRDQGLLAKLALRPGKGQELNLTLEGAKQDTDVVVKRLHTSLPKVTAMDGDDHGERLRGTLEWRHLPGGGLYDRLSARFYRQNSETVNNNRQTRTNTSAGCSAVSGSGNNCAVVQEFSFEQTLTGAGVQMERAFDGHFLIAGLELSRMETEQRRDATVHNLTTGTTSKSLAGDSFPLRDFAPGYTDTVGLYVQDDIELMGGGFTLTPALRYDWRKLKPEPDALSLAVLAANNNQAVGQTDGAFSPKLAGLWRLGPEWSLFGHIARGFRAPSYDEVNGHFRNTAQSYGVAPNPDLKPETSWGGELGLRRARAGLKGQLSVYDNRYEDFIESVRLTCPGDPRCIVGLANTSMSQNLAKVRIYGAEARAAWDIRPGWRLSGALAYAHGQDEDLDRPLNSIEPARMVLALAHDAGRWGAETRLRAAQAVKRVDDCLTAACTGTGHSPWFRPPGYGVLDISAWYEPVKSARLMLAVNNLFDKKYWLWSDIRSADARNPLGVDFYSQPGRNLSIALQADF
jgi:hemoglobin/transferrin/lactoferrin receptor protein